MKRARWALAGAVIVVATIALSAYLWRFEVRGRVATVSTWRSGAYEVTLYARRTSAWLPWLSTHEVEVAGAEGRSWSARASVPPGPGAWGIPLVLAQDDELVLVDERGTRAYALENGALRWADAGHAEAARAVGGVSVVLFEGGAVVRAMDHTTGAARWSRPAALAPGQPFEGAITPLGAHEALVGVELVDLRTGAPDPAVPEDVVIVGDELFWPAGDALMRRPARGPARRVLSLPSLGWIDARIVGDAVLLHVSRIAQWAPDVGVRAEPARVPLDALTARDDAILALGPRDEVRWTVAMGHGLWRWCAAAPLDPRVIVVESSRAAGDAYVDSAFAIDVETGTVLALDAPSPCP